MSEATSARTSRRTALVIGGSRGLGQAVVERLAADGIDVAFTYANNHDAAAAVERTVAAGGGKARGHQSDATDLDALRALIDTVAPLDVLVHNAAVFPVPSPLSETPIETFDQTMALNARSAFATLAAAATAVRPGGAVITVSSIVAKTRPAGMAVYAASKAAVEAMTTTAARELGPRDITVNSVVAGAIDTDALRAVQSPEALEQTGHRTPLGRIAHGGDIAAVIAFLAGPDSRWVTGRHLCADGGLS